MVLLIHKGDGEYCGIGLVEVVWKEVMETINFCFTASIDFHGVLHGFRGGHVTGTASLEAKLIQKLMDMR